MTVSFFNNINGKSLDSEQRTACLCSNRFVQVVAGAGSGKTTTIVGKVKYLVEKLGVSPSDILLISFTKAAANEMNERVNGRLSLGVDCVTFHKLGLLIIGDVCGVKPKILSADMSELIRSRLLKLLRDRHNKKVFKRYFKISGAKDYNANINSFVSLCLSVINHLKSGETSVESFIKRSRVLKGRRHRKAFKLFMHFFDDILQFYTTYLSKTCQVDFNDMINNARELVENRKFISPYRYIIVDEYQDISVSRFNLVKSLVMQNDKCQLFVVGDDWQSIYRFAGSTVSLFTNFSDYFIDSKIIKIKRTYRYTQKLADVTGGFIMVNNAQLKKDITSYAPIIANPITIYKKPLSKHGKLLGDILFSIHNNDNSCEKSVLILGRYYSDIRYITECKYLKVTPQTELITDTRNPNINIRFMTVHSSKGLEADHVVILGCIGGVRGFPSIIKDNFILELLLPKFESFAHAEERRLFYVALTRTRETVHILSAKESPSVFVKEIKKLL